CERELAAASVLSEADCGDGVRRPLRPPVDAVVRDRDAAAREPRRPLRPARVVEDALPRRRELEPHVLDRERPEPVRVGRRPAYELPPAVDARAALKSR